MRTEKQNFAVERRIPYEVQLDGPYVSHVRRELDWMMLQQLIDFVGGRAAIIEIGAVVEEEVLAAWMPRLAKGLDLRLRRRATVTVEREAPPPKPRTDSPPTFACDYCRNVFHACAACTTDGKDRCCPNCFRQQS